MNSTYQSKARITGESGRALNALREIFVNNNFRVTIQGESGFEIEGPGLNSTHQNPLLGISHGACRV